MGLFRGAVFRFRGGARKQPINQLTESAKTKRGRREGDGKKNVTTICDKRHDNLRHGTTICDIL